MTRRRASDSNDSDCEWHEAAAAWQTVTVTGQGPRPGPESYRALARPAQLRAALPVGFARRLEYHASAGLAETNRTRSS